MFNDSLIEFIAADTDGIGNDHTEQGDNRHLSRTAADITYHITGRFGNRNIGADRRRKRFLKHFDTTGTRF